MAKAYLFIVRSEQSQCLLVDALYISSKPPIRNEEGLYGPQAEDFCLTLNEGDVQDVPNSLNDISVSMTIPSRSEDGEPLPANGILASLNLPTLNELPPAVQKGEKYLIINISVAGTASLPKPKPKKAVKKNEENVGEHKYSLYVLDFFDDTIEKIRPLPFGWRVYQEDIISTILDVEIENRDWRNENTPLTTRTIESKDISLCEDMPQFIEKRRERSKELRLRAEYDFFAKKNIIGVYELTTDESDIYIVVKD